MGKRIGVLVTGHAPENLTREYGDYADMFGALLQTVDPSIETEAVDVINGAPLPGDAGEYDGYIITGSRHSVYEDLPWIAPLEDFTRTAAAKSVPNVGICFGHQLMAQAFGGKVEKSSKGWGLGLRFYEPRTGWTDPMGNSATFLAPTAHQDQVTAAPKNGRLVMGSYFCPVGALEYPGRAVSVQFHPEFSSKFLEALITARRDGGAIPEAEAALGLSTIGGGDDGRLRIAKWMVWHLNGGGAV
ncbi:MAG: type 1 glutamine amidotransferase [Rhodospirillales bacterium]